MILAAVDGSTTSYRALAWAAGQARRQKARLLCVYVAHHSGLATNAWTTSGAGVPLNSDTDQVADDIARYVSVNARRINIEPELLVRDGDPASAIAQLADELRVDAVVVGASMKAGHRLVGSVATRLVRTGRWPVTVVP